MTREAPAALGGGKQVWSPSLFKVRTGGPGGTKLVAPKFSIH